MDEKRLSDKNLADILNLKFLSIKELLNQFSKPDISYKSDGSPVTLLDVALSEHLEVELRSHFPDHTFYSEENFSGWCFPLIAVDPLDGTREYIAGRPEWAISVGIFKSENFEGEGWVCNPVSDEHFTMGSAGYFSPMERYSGEVSRSEWESGLFKNFLSEKFKLSPMGSIAYKLGKLSQGKTDFVVSLYPKNIWDIAGGSLLAQQAGIKFYSQGKEVTKVQKFYQPPLIWCHPSLFSELAKLFP